MVSSPHCGVECFCFCCNPSGSPIPINSIKRALCVRYSELDGFPHHWCLSAHPGALIAFWPQRLAVASTTADLNMGRSHSKS